jgi:small GTP-binding protein
MAHKFRIEELTSRRFYLIVIHSSGRLFQAMSVQRRDPRRPAHKVVLLGDSRVGKTSLIQRQFQGFEPAAPMPTIGCHSRSFVFTIDEKPFNLEVWDTAGQEMYRALVPVYLRGTGGAIVLYDLTDRESFDSLSYWIRILDEALPADTILFIVANKADLKDRIAVKDEDGMAYAAEHKASFFKASAITGEGVEEIFQGMANELARKVRIDTQAFKPNPDVVHERQCPC